MKNITILCVLSLGLIQSIQADTQTIRIAKQSFAPSTQLNPLTNNDVKGEPITLRNITNPNCQQAQVDQFKEALLQAINEIRQHPRQCGAQYRPATSTLKWNRQLQQSATLQAQDLAKRNTLSHIDTFGKRLKDRFELVGYKGEIGGENLAHGQKTAHQVLNDWMTLSTIHCNNIMTNGYTDYALACKINPNTGRAYWVQHFGRR